MPFGDGTGPMGMGPMTGRGMGYCAGFPTPGYMNPALVEVGLASVEDEAEVGDIGIMQQVCLAG